MNRSSLLARSVFMMLLVVAIAVLSGCKPKVEIKGTVTNMRDGLPLAGAVVKVFDTNGEEADKAITTDETGAFSFKVLALTDDINGDGEDDPATYTLNVANAGFWPYPNEWQPETPLNMADAQTTGRKWGRDVRVYQNDLTAIKLLRQIVMNGTVFAVSAPGTGVTPTAGLSVQAVDANGAPVGAPFITDAAGNYQLMLPECWDDNNDGVFAVGGYLLEIQPDTYQPFMDGLVPPTVIDMSTALPVTAEEGGAVSYVVDTPQTDALVVPFVVIRGVVTNNCGGPLAGVSVAVLDTNEEPVLPAVTTDAQGAYQVNAPKFWVFQQGCTLPGSLQEGGGPACEFVNGVYTLQVKAEGYGAYPSAARPAQPLAMAEAPATTSPPVIDNASTSIVMLREVTVRGMVQTCPNNDPITGASVSVVDDTEKVVAGPVATDATGHYELMVPQSWDADGDGQYTVGQYTLKVEAAGYWPFPSAISPAETFAVPGCDATGELVVNLNPVTVVREIAIRGTLAAVTAAGSVAAPLAGTTVQAVDLNGAPVGEPAVTDATGHYELLVPQCWDANGDGISEPGVYTLAIQSDQYQSIMDGILPDTTIDVSTATEVAGPDGETVLVIEGDQTNLVVAPTVRIRGTITDNCDQPVAGATVSALDAGGLPVAPSVATDALGTYELPVPQYWVAERGCSPASAKQALPVCDYVVGVYTLEVRAQDYGTYPSVSRPAVPLNMLDAVPVDGQLVLQNADTSIMLQRDILLEGLVLDYVAGTPIAGAQVWAMDDQGADVAGPVLTDASGHYTIVVPQAWDSDGNGQYTLGAYSLRVEADRYWPFPSNLTPSQPFDVLGCEASGGAAMAMPDIRLVREVLLRGMVLDLADDAPIAGAQVQPADINGTPVGSTAITDENGNYELIVPQIWDLDGVLDGQSVVAYGVYMLRCQAMGYQEFPTAIRPSLPIDVQVAVEQPPAAGQTAGDLLIDGTLSTLTTIKMIALPGDVSLLGSIAGNIFSTRNAGVLVVATNDGTGKAYTSFSGFGGEYVIFNTPAGTYTVEGYALGIQLTPANSVAVAAGEAKTGVDLSESGNPLNTVTGSIQMVNAPGGAVTSVVLAVESTFDANAARGTVPPGLRVANVTGGFTIENVPDGRYVVLAAFENDELVRDPDTNIAGTQIVHLEVPGPGGEHAITIPNSFKITQALAVVGPGTDGPEAVHTLTPTLQWADDSSEDGYQIWVYDSFGNEMWNWTIPGVSGSTVVSLDYAGTALTPGMYYQFKAQSIRKTSYISATEDLKGVFYYEP